MPFSSADKFFNLFFKELNVVTLSNLSFDDRKKINLLQQLNINYCNYFEAGIVELLLNKRANKYFLFIHNN